MLLKFIQNLAKITIFSGFKKLFRRNFTKNHLFAKDVGFLRKKTYLRGSYESKIGNTYLCTLCVGSNHGAKCRYWRACTKGKIL